MDEQEYRHYYTIIRDDVYKARCSFYTYSEIHAFAGASPGNYEKINRGAPFWEIIQYGLQESFVVSLGRLFDRDDDSHSITKLLSATADNPHIFSKAALSRRKMPDGRMPDWLDAFMADPDVWEPKAGELDFLKGVFAQYIHKIELVCRIRNKVFAHRDIATHETRQRFDEFVGQAQLADIQSILDDAYDVLEQIDMLYRDGVKPNLGCYRDRRSEEMRSEARAVLTSLPQGGM